MNGRTQVAIVGAGPAGLVLAHLLHLRGIDSVVLERQTRHHVESRIRAGVLEPGTVDLLHRIGLADRLLRERMVHHGVELLFDGEGHRVPLAELAGQPITIYGQHELVKDLVATRLATDRPLLFEAAAVAVDPHDGVVTYVHSGQTHELRADLIAGCDGYHGVCRSSMGDDNAYDHSYPFAWLGILAQAPPSSDELIYGYHPDGFALHSMRSPQLTRLYLQVDPTDQLSAWPDERIWAQLRQRLARHTPWHLHDGPIIERGITALRSYVCASMTRGNLFLAGDAAHIVPATGAKGLNLAIADVHLLAQAIGDNARLAAYQQACLRRVWRVQHFCWWMTSMLHQTGDRFTNQLQLAQLRYLVSSRAAMTSFAENYVGLPWEESP